MIQPENVRNVIQLAKPVMELMIINVPLVKMPHFIKINVYQIVLQDFTLTIMYVNNVAVLAKNVLVQNVINVHLVTRNSI